MGNAKLNNSALRIRHCALFFSSVLILTLQLLPFVHKHEKMNNIGGIDMKWWARIIQDKKTDKMQKALLCRRRQIVVMAEKGFSDIAIAFYFEIRPAMVAKIINDSDKSNILESRYSSLDEIKALLDDRDKNLKNISEKTLLANGFIYQPEYYSCMDSLGQMHAANWQINEMMAFYRDVVGKKISQRAVSRRNSEVKGKHPENKDKVLGLLQEGYRGYDVQEYLSLPEHTITDVYNKSNISREELLKAKTRTRREKVYEYRVKMGMSEFQTSEKLGISRSTVSTDLKRFFVENPDLIGEKYAPERHRRAVGRDDKVYDGNLSEKEADIIRLRKKGASIKKIVCETRVLEPDVIKYIRENESNREGTLYEWKQDMIAQIMSKENKDLTIKELTAKLGMPMHFVSHIRKQNK